MKRYSSFWPRISSLNFKKNSSFISKTKLKGIKPQEKFTKILSYELKRKRTRNSIKQQTYFLQLYNQKELNEVVPSN